MTDLTTIFPTAAELPPGWELDAWWSAIRGTMATGLRRVYLNGGGTDHELRFHVFPPGDQWRSNRNLWPDCDRCKGTGRLNRPAHEQPIFLSALMKPGQEYDAADEKGLRRCDAMNCDHGRTEPIYGAANSRIRVPNFPPDLLRKTGNRGMSEPTKGDILRTIQWCDDMLKVICNRPHQGRYP